MASPQLMASSEIVRQPSLEEMHARLQPGPQDQGQSVRDYFLRQVARYGDPVLVIGASDLELIGALASAGKVVDIVEDSASVCARLRQAAMERGLHLNLFVVSAGDLDLARVYGTILVPQSGLTRLLDRAQVLGALSALLRHLQPVGALSFDLNGPPAWPPGASEPPVESKPSRSVTLLAERRLLSLDLVDQTYVEQHIFRLFEGDRLIRTTYRSVRQRWYSRGEMTRMLTWAGFTRIEVSGTRPEASPPQRDVPLAGMVFTARPAVPPDAGPDDQVHRFSAHRKREGVDYDHRP